MKTAYSKQIRDADSKAIHILGIPSTLLMTNAAKALVSAALEFPCPDRKAVIFCGSGNNGGDGLGAGAGLLRRGWSVRCFLAGNREKMTPDCAEMERRLIELGGRLEDFDPENPLHRKAAMEADIVIDAIFGIGLNSPLKGTAAAAVELINSCPAPVISADIPSGVEADTGRILGCAVKADMTVTFSMAKPGHFIEPGRVCRGSLRVADIGIPKDVLEDAVCDVSAILPHELSLPPRAPLSHKGDYGRLLVVGGSMEFSGAPALCAQAAARSGAGLVSLAVPSGIYAPTAARMWEVMVSPMPEDGSGKLSSNCLPVLMEKLNASHVGVVGCGLGRSEELEDLVRALLWESQTPLVIDADGLFALGSDPETLRRAKKPPVLTPHQGEFLRLGGKITGDRAGEARNFARSRNCVLVLKGHRTLCAFPDGEVRVADAGNPGMARGGSGDVLAGIIGAFMCQLPLKEAVSAACLVHAAAGDLCAERFGEYSMLPTDMINILPEITKKLTENPMLRRD